MDTALPSILSCCNGVMLVFFFRWRISSASLMNTSSVGTGASKTKINKKKGKQRVQFPSQ